MFVVVATAKHPDDDTFETVAIAPGTRSVARSHDDNFCNTSQTGVVAVTKQLYIMILIAYSRMRDNTILTGKHVVG